MLIDFDFRTSLIAATIIFAGTNLPAQTTCEDLGDPRGDGRPDEFCIPLSPGAPGGPASVDLNGLMFPVPDSNRIDLHTTFTSWIDVPSGSPVNFSTSLSWSTPVDLASLSASEFAVNFLLDPIQFSVLGRSSGDPPKPEFTLNGDGEAVGWTFANQSIESIGWPEGIERFHIITTGLPAGEIVTLSHQVTGGVVVPEPGGAVMLIIGITAAVARLRRRRRNPDHLQ